MIRIFSILSIVACLSGLGLSTLADTVVIKGGQRIDGLITNETATDLTIQIRVSPSITDERVILKSEIAKFDRTAEDEVVYRSLMDLQPGRSSFLAGQYAPVIEALQGFLAKYPDSPHAANVRATLVIFQTEKTRVAAGEVKFEGRWLSREAAGLLRVQIGGSQIFDAMKLAGARGDVSGALNLFAQLEKNYSGARVMPDAIPLAEQILSTGRAAALRAKENLASAKIEREKGFAAAGKTDREEMMAAYQAEQSRAEARLATAISAGLWPPLQQSNEKSINAFLEKTASETKRLQSLPVAEMRTSIQLSEKARNELTSGNIPAATLTIKEASKLWPANEFALRLAAEVAAIKPPPAVAATPAPATPKVNAATPLPATPAPVAAVKTDADRDPTAVPDTASEPATKKPFFMTLGGALSIVVVLALLFGGFTVYNYLKPSNHQSED